MAAPDFNDTIVALSSPPGPGGRAVVRLSGPEARRSTATIFKPSGVLQTAIRTRHPGQLYLSGVSSCLDADVILWPAPNTYTGQDIIELHTLSCPPLLDLVVEQLLNNGCRAAQPGEFTLRAFLAGKLDLPRAEAVLGIIEAGSREEMKQALAQLAGGVTRPLHALREDLLDLLAELEAGLDFADEDIQFVGRDQLLYRLARGLAQVTIVQKQLEQRAVTNRPFRVVLVGRPNAGKSSLFNALIGKPAALVSAEPATTRDYLVGTLQVGDISLELVDTAGRQESVSAIDEQSQQLGSAQAERADLLLLCLEAGARSSPFPLVGEGWGGGHLVVATKCDLVPAPPSMLATSSINGMGLDDLRTVLADHARAHSRAAMAPSLSRCRHHVDACIGHLRQAYSAVLFEDPAEILALELRAALDQLGEMIGAVYTDDLLDRIFSRFCIGK